MAGWKTRAAALAGLGALAGLAGLGGCTQISETEARAAGEAAGAARALRACPRAIARQTGAQAVTLNTEIVVVEVNQYIFDVPGEDRPWTCVTDDAGAPQFLYPARVIG